MATTHVKPELITAVLIGGEWDGVRPGTFKTGSFILVPANGEKYSAANWPPGFEYTSTTGGVQVSGPRSALQAVRWASQE